MLASFTISQIKAHYTALYTKFSAQESVQNYCKFLKTVISELSWGLKVDLTLIDKELEDPVLCKTNKFDAIDALSRVLLPLAEAINYKATIHPDWSLLAGRMEIQRIKLIVPETFKEMLEINPKLWRNDEKNNYYDFASKNAKELETIIAPERDYDLYFFGVRTLQKSYLMKLDGKQILETPQRMYLRIAAFLWMPDITNIQKYYNHMSMGDFTHASPTMFNAGIAKGSLASCFLLSMQDDLEKIFKCLGQCAMISKATGGIGLDITNIRHSKIGHMGQSSGIVPMLKVYDAGMRYVNQGGRRKGSATIFLQPWHIDFLDFLLLKRQHGAEERRARDLFYSVWNCDIFMDRVQKDAEWTLFCPKYTPMLKDTYGEEFEQWYLHYENTLGKQPNNEHCVKKLPARQLWNEILTTQIETGMPFMTNKDTANETSNQKNLGLIRSSNLCVAGNTLILTKNGHQPIKSLVNNPVEIWNGFEWSIVVPKCTSKTPVKLLTVTFSNGSELKCTPEHRFYIVNQSGKTIEKTAQTLKPNDQLISWRLPIVSEYNSQSDNTIDCNYSNGFRKVAHGNTLSEKLEWFAGLTDGNGTINEKGEINISMPTHSFAIYCQCLCQTLGIHSQIKGENTNVVELHIPNDQLSILVKMGIQFRFQKTFNPAVPTKITKSVNTITIKQVIYNNDIEPTYCFTEPINHTGIFNGVITGQCQEIMEVTDEDTISSCNLASIALDEYVETINGEPIYNHQRLGEITRLIVRGLNHVIDRTFYPLQTSDKDGPIKETNLKYRPLGIGVQALADAFLKMKLAWTDAKARELNKEIFATIYYHAMDESVELAKEDGIYDGFVNSPASKGILKPHLIAMEQVRKDPTKNYDEILEKQLSKNYDWNALAEKVKTNGLRNSLLIALMPTASSAQIRYKNEAFEPFTTNMYVRSVLAGNHLIVNRYMVEELEELGLWNKSVVNFIIKNEGSIAGIPVTVVDPSKRDKLIRIQEKCKTAFELSQKLLVDMSIDRCFYVCQSQSLNIHIKDPTFKQLTSLHFYAWKNALATGMYYLRTAPTTEAVKFTVDGDLDVEKTIICTEDVCISCQS